MVYFLDILSKSCQILKNNQVLEFQSAPLYQAGGKLTVKCLVVNNLAKQIEVLPKVTVESYQDHHFIRELVFPSISFEPGAEKEFIFGLP